MTKAKSKAARRKLKRAITLAGGGSVPQPATQGRRADLEPKEAADVVALTARARRTGCSVEDARDVLAGEDMGRCIMAMRPGAEDRRALLGVWQGLCASWANYCARCLSITPTPQAAALPMLPEPMQTDQSLRVDLRTGDERDEAARRVWFEWLTALMDLPPDQRHALRGHLQGYGAEVWSEEATAPTRAGALAIKALATLHLARSR
ncbi:hypothetical protein [Pararhodobacter sp. CCB-MM2]|uniref:hypothetical protein n=1 Tax=Pararhodobacter sp. CCB-MM2 TaxID=1786003 RepID=UPI000832F6B8|nr:hypothetical protein [Pararhodobacter sp. CCB-MM2]